MAIIINQIGLTKRIFHRNNIGYVDIPRTGSTSIRHMLSELDFTTTTFQQRPDLHLFTVTRHPFPRLISATIGYTNTRLLLGGHAPTEMVLDTAKQIATSLNEKTFRPLSEHMIPQVDYIEWDLDSVFKIESNYRVVGLLAEYGFVGELPHLQAADLGLKNEVLRVLAPVRAQVMEYYERDFAIWDAAT